MHLLHTYLCFYFLSRCTSQSEQRLTAWLLFTVLYFNRDRFEPSNVLVSELIKVQRLPSPPTFNIASLSGTGINTHLNWLLTSKIFCFCSFISVAYCWFHSSILTPVYPCAPAHRHKTLRAVNFHTGNYRNSFSLNYRRTEDRVTGRPDGKLHLYNRVVTHVWTWARSTEPIFTFHSPV